jgi:hypothetical protein
MNHQDRKIQARQKLHQKLSEVVWYTSVSGDPINFQVPARVLSRNATFGDYDGIGYANQHTSPITVILLSVDVENLQRGDTFRRQTGEIIRAEIGVEAEPPYSVCGAIET